MYLVTEAGRPENRYRKKELVGLEVKGRKISKMARRSYKTGEVFVLYRDSLLAAGLERLLHDVGRVVVPIDLKQAWAWQRLQRALKPGNLVIVDKRDGKVHPSLTIMQLFLNNPEISIIGLDSCENKLELYSRRGKEVRELSGLTEVIACILHIKPKGAR